MLVKHTVDSFAKEHNYSRQYAINKLAKLKKKGFAISSGGGKQPKTYTISNKYIRPTNGFYDVVNKYSPEKLVPKFKHYVLGAYRIENAIVDGLKIGDRRTLEATKYLFRNIKDWTFLFQLLKKHNLEKNFFELYEKAKQEIKVRRIPKRYKNDKY